MQRVGRILTMTWIAEEQKKVNGEREMRKRRRQTEKRISFIFFFLCFTEIAVPTSSYIWKRRKKIRFYYGDSNCHKYKKGTLWIENEMALKKKKKYKSLQHPVFPGGHPSKY